MSPQWLELPASSVAPALLLISDKRTIAYAGGVVFLIVFFCYCLWILAVFAWFRKPIEVSGTCPHCGSKDLRPSYDLSAMDRIRKKLGIFPFRCRGCTRRFFSRSSNGGRAGIPEVLAD
jgi:hypothetical protein